VWCWKGRWRSRGRTASSAAGRPNVRDKRVKVVGRRCRSCIMAEARKARGVSGGEVIVCFVVARDGWYSIVDEQIGGVEWYLYFAVPAAFWSWGL
jgi:hypothetical protein